MEATYPDEVLNVYVESEPAHIVMFNPLVI
jgi:hypothetical protein